jgi:hypothetical protein
MMVVDYSEGGMQVRPAKMTVCCDDDVVTWRCRSKIDVEIQNHGLLGTCFRVRAVPSIRKLAQPSW